MKTAVKVTLLGAVLMASAAALSAQSLTSSAKPLPAPPSASAGKEKRKVTATGDQLRQKETAAGTVVTFQGNVKFVSDDTIMVTDMAVYNRQTQIANSPGKLKIDDDRNTIIGNTGLAYYKTRDTRITGSVVITVRPKPADQSAPDGSLRKDFKDPAIILCDRVDYNWRSKIAVVPGKLTVKQKDRTVTADKAVYDANTETVTLTGNVKAVDAKGRRGEGTEAFIILREGAEEFIIKGPITATFDLEDEEETPNGAAKPGTPAKGDGTVAPVTLPPPPSPTPGTPEKKPETPPAFPEKKPEKETP